MHASAELFSEFRESFVRAQDEEMGLEEFLQYCKTDRMAYATAHDCVLEAIGKPTLLNTAEDPRLSRIFQNRIIQSWETFAEFHGMEDTLMSLYAYFLHAAQGLEERKQVVTAQESLRSTTAGLLRRPRWALKVALAATAAVAAAFALTRRRKAKGR